MQYCWTFGIVALLLARLCSLETLETHGSWSRGSSQTEGGLDLGLRLEYRVSVISLNQFKFKFMWRSLGVGRSKDNEYALSV